MKPVQLLSIRRIQRLLALLLGMGLLPALSAAAPERDNPLGFQRMADALVLADLLPPPHGRCSLSRD